MIALLIARRITAPAAHYAQQLNWVPAVARHLARHPLHALLLLGAGWKPVVFVADLLSKLGLLRALRWWLAKTGYLAAVQSIGFDPEGFHVL